MTKILQVFVPQKIEKILQDFVPGTNRENFCPSGKIERQNFSTSKMYLTDRHGWGRPHRYKACTRIVTGGGGRPPVTKTKREFGLTTNSSFSSKLTINVFVVYPFFSKDI